MRNPYVDIFGDTTASDLNEQELIFDSAPDVNAWASSFNAARAANKSAIGTDVLAEEGRYYRGMQGGPELALGSKDYENTWNSGVDFVANNAGQFLYQDANGKLVLDTKGTDIDLVLAGLGKLDPELPNKLIKDQDFKLQDKEKGIYHVVSSKNFVDTLGKIAPMVALTALGTPALAGALGTSSATAGALLNAGVSAAKGGNIEDIVKNAALSYAGGALGDRIAAGTEFGINPFGEQAGMFADQVSGMSGAYGFLPTALGETSSKLVQGKDLEEAVLGGVVSGLKNTDFDTKGSNLGFDITTPQFLRDFDKAILQPVTKPIAEAAQYVDDEYIDPFVSTVKDTLDPLQEAGREFDRGVLQPIKETVVEAGEAVADALPDIDLPDVDWKGLFGTLLAGANGMFSGSGGMGVTKAPEEEAIQTELFDYKPITPYRSKLSPNARLLG